MHLVMLETNGNQRFIFSSPRLRDSVGASSLLTKLKQWTAQELLATGAAAALAAAEYFSRLRSASLDASSGEESEIRQGRQACTRSSAAGTAFGDRSSKINTQIHGAGTGDASKAHWCNRIAASLPPASAGVHQEAYSWASTCEVSVVSVGRRAGGIG